MKVYQVQNYIAEDELILGYCGSLAEAQKIVVGRASHIWSGIIVYEGEVPNDKAGMLAALNGNARFTRGNDSWSVGQRGGLTKRA